MHTDREIPTLKSAVNFLRRERKTTRDPSPVVGSSAPRPAATALNPHATPLFRSVYHISDSSPSPPPCPHPHQPTQPAGDDVHLGAARPGLRPHPHRRRRAPPGPRAHRLHPLRARLGARRGPGPAHPGGGPGHRRRGPLLLQRPRHRVGGHLPRAARGARRRAPPRRRRPARPPHAHRRRRHRPCLRRRLPPRALPRLPRHARRPRRALHERGRHRPPPPALLRARPPRQDLPGARAPGRRAQGEEAPGPRGQGARHRRRRLPRRARDRRRGHQTRRAVCLQEVGRRRLRVHQDVHFPRRVQGGWDRRGERRGEDPALRFQALIGSFYRA